MIRDAVDKTESHVPEASFRLVETDDNAAPLGARTTVLTARDGVRLRAAVWTPHSPRGTVALFGGRGEFIEKYFETIGELLSRGFAVACLDWRGQGGSDRLLRNRRKGHVEDFSHYERDLESFVAGMLEPHCPRPWFAVAHSMGAAIALKAAQSGRCPFERLFLTSPMIEIHGLRYPRAARATAAVLDFFGLGGLYAPGGGDRGVESMTFANNALTSDERRFTRLVKLARAAPELNLGWPTIGWINAAFRAIQTLSSPGFPESILTPTLMIIAGDDRITDTRAAERFGSRLRSGQVIVLEDAQHEVFTEVEKHRGPCWAAFDAFIPGSPPNLGEKRVKAPVH